MEYIKLNEENLEKEHICCAISNNKDIGLAAKKRWLQDRFSEGLVFLKGDVRGKCFIEYIPSEYAWVPVKAPDYMHINCLWVSGQFKGKGYSNDLLNQCIADSKQKGKLGLTILSSVKKKGFLADPDYLNHKGFVLADTADPFFTLMYLPFDQNSPKPCFSPSVGNEKDMQNIPKGLSAYYTAQCPFSAKYISILDNIAKARNALFTPIEITSCLQAQSFVAAYTSFAMFYNGEYLTHEIPSEKKFEKLLDEFGL